MKHEVPIQKRRKLDSSDAPVVETDGATNSKVDAEPKVTEESQQHQAEQSVNVEIEERVENGLTICHLKDECLEKIFRQLSIPDLINVAESNVHLANIAKMIISQMFHNNRLNIIIKGGLVHCPQWCFSSDISYVQISFEMVTMFFQHFGKCLRKLQIFFTPVGLRGSQEYTFARLLADYCCDTLIELDCRGASVQNLFYYLKKPFLRLEKLIFSEIFTSAASRAKPIENMIETFPNLRSLEFHNVRHVFVHFNVQRLPLLEHFGIYTHPYATFEKEYFPHIHQFTILNPQLSSLGMYDIQESHEELQLVPMPSIRKLEIGELYLHPSPPFLYENVTDMRITYFGRGKSEWRTLPPQLEHLELAGFHINENTVNLPLQCPNLTSITFIACEMYELKCVHEIAKSLPQIREIEFISHFEEDVQKMLAFSSALIFMQHCAQLRKAVATVRVKRKEFQFKNAHWEFTESRELLKKYHEKIKETLVLNWWRWPMKHELKIIDYIKGWRSEPSFRVSMEIIRRNDD